MVIESLGKQRALETILALCVDNQSLAEPDFSHTLAPKPTKVIATNLQAPRTVTLGVSSSRNGKPYQFVLRRYPFTSPFMDATEPDTADLYRTDTGFAVQFHRKPDIGKLERRYLPPYLKEGQSRIEKRSVSQARCLPEDGLGRPGKETVCGESV